MFILKLVIKNALRHKLRTILTIAGIAVAVMSFGFLRTVVTAWSYGVEASAANRMITRNAVSFIFPLPYSYRDQIARVPGRLPTSPGPTGSAGCTRTRRISRTSSPGWRSIRTPISRSIRS